MAIHARDIRLSNNAGMAFPVCAAQAPLLDTDKSRWLTTGDIHLVTCQNCLRTWPKRYPWATQRAKIA
jgi:hypothetical protein